MIDQLGWRYFGTRDVLLARSWASGEGIAVHENLFRLKGHRCAHLLAPDEAILLAAAELLGCHSRWIQRTRTPHFDLVGDFLTRALIRCGVSPDLPPARTVATWPHDRPG